MAADGWRRSSHRVLPAQCPTESIVSSAGQRAHSGVIQRQARSSVNSYYLYEGSGLLKLLILKSLIIIPRRIGMRRPPLSPAKDLVPMTVRRSRSRHLVVAFALCCSILTAGILHGQEVSSAATSPALDDSAQTVGASAESVMSPCASFPQTFSVIRRIYGSFRKSSRRGGIGYPPLRLSG